MSNGTPPPPPPEQPPSSPGHGGPASGSGAPFGGSGAPQYGPSGPQGGPTGPQAGPQYGSGPQANVPPAPFGSAPQYGATGPQGSLYESAPQTTPQPQQFGGPQSGSTGQPGAFGAPNAQQKKKKSRKPLIISAIAVGCVLLLLIVGIIVVNSVNRSQYGPDKVAQEYLTALEAGDYEAASAIAEPSVPETASTALLDPKFVEASADKLADVQVTDTQIDGDNAVINATYTMAGNSYDLALNATRDGRQGLFFDNWKLTAPPLAAITIPAPAGMTTTLNGQEFTAEEATTEYAVYPGTYQVEVESTDFVEGATDQATVALGDADSTAPVELDLPIQATGALNDEVQKQVEDKVDKCASDTKNAESEAKDGCPFFLTPNGSEDPSPLEDIEPGSMDWKVDKQPTVEVVLSDAGSATFFTTTRGAISFTADSKRANYTWTGDGSLSMSGSVAIDGDKVTLDFN